MKFCDAVKYVRIKKLYLTQEEFAKELGIGYATLNRLENNSLQTSAKVKRKFYHILRNLKLMWRNSYEISN